MITFPLRILSAIPICESILANDCSKEISLHVNIFPYESHRVSDHVANSGCTNLLPSAIYFFHSRGGCAAAGEEGPLLSHGGCQKEPHPALTDLA